MRPSLPRDPVRPAFSSARGEKTQTTLILVVVFFWVAANWGDVKTGARDGWVETQDHTVP